MQPYSVLHGGRSAGARARSAARDREKGLQAMQIRARVADGPAASSRAARRGLRATATPGRPGGSPESPLSQERLDHTLVLLGLARAGGVDEPAAGARPRLARMAQQRPLRRGRALSRSAAARRHRMSTSRRSVPSPEHGASTSTRSKTSPNGAPRSRDRASTIRARSTDRTAAARSRAAAQRAASGGPPRPGGRRTRRARRRASASCRPERRRRRASARRDAGPAMSGTSCEARPAPRTGPAVARATCAAGSRAARRSPSGANRSGRGLDAFASRSRSTERSRGCLRACSRESSARAPRLLNSTHAAAPPGPSGPAIARRASADASRVMLSASSH